MSDTGSINRNSIQEHKNKITWDVIDFDPGGSISKSGSIYINEPSGESSTDELGKTKNVCTLQNDREDAGKGGENSFEMENLLDEPTTKDIENYDTGFVNPAFEENEVKITTENGHNQADDSIVTGNYSKLEGTDNKRFSQDDDSAAFEVTEVKTTRENGYNQDDDSKVTGHYSKLKGTDNNKISHGDDSADNGEYHLDNAETIIYGHDAVDTEEESNDDLKATVKPHLNSDTRNGEISNSLGSSRLSVKSSISSRENDVSSPKDKQTQSDSHLSGTGHEFVKDNDVKIDVPDQADDSIYNNNKAESEENGDDGYDYEDEDIWALPEFKSEEKPWSELTRKEKIIKVLWHYIGKGLLLMSLLYIFICSLSFLGDAFKLLGGKAAGKAFTNVDILSNRLAGVIIGVLATVLLQSSSTTTSIVVSMVGSGSLLTVRQAIPIIMGANIGTTITNTIVAIGQINHKEDFRRAFAGATVHDVFNWLNVLVMLLLEEIFGYLEALTGAIVKNFEPGEASGSDNDYLKALTDPFTKLIIQIDKKVITRIATGNITGDGQSIIKHKCGNSTCKFMFEHVSSPEGGGWSDEAVGVILLLISLFLLCLCLILIVKILHSLLKGHIAKWIRKFINANLPGKLSYFTGYIALLIGAGITILVQSSSIFTSSLTPLVGMGVLSLDRMYPLTLGSNIGTTGTGIIAAFAQDPNQMKDALQIALCHLFFNITGILIFYPIPFMRLPIRAAKFLGIRSAEYRWFAVLYIIFPYFVLPALGLGLSLIHIALLITVLVLIAVIVIAIIVIKIMQAKFPRFLPQKLRNWKWLPEWMRSLEPTDRLIQRVLKRLGRLKLFIYCRKYCPCKRCKSTDPNYD